MGSYRRKGGYMISLKALPLRVFHICKLCHITCLTHLFHFFLTVNLHLGTAARSEVDLSEWFQLPILGYQGMVSEEEKSRFMPSVLTAHTHTHT